MNLKGRNFLKLMDFTPEEITYMNDLAADLKAKKKQGIPHDSLTGKNIALIFEKTSTRTRCSFEVAKAAGYEKFIMFLHYPPTSIGEMDEHLSLVGLLNGKLSQLFTECHLTDSYITKLYEIYGIL